MEEVSLVTSIMLKKNHGSYGAGGTGSKSHAQTIAAGRGRAIIILL
jgi:hypothetical protein